MSFLFSSFLRKSNEVFGFGKLKTYWFSIGSQNVSQPQLRINIPVAETTFLSLAGVHWTQIIKPSSLSFSIYFFIQDSDTDVDEEYTFKGTVLQSK